MLVCVLCLCAVCSCVCLWCSIRMYVRACVPRLTCLDTLYCAVSGGNGIAVDGWSKVLWCWWCCGGGAGVLVILWCCGVVVLWCWWCCGVGGDVNVVWVL